FCNFRLKQRGKTEGGVQTYRWILEQFLIFIRNRHGRLARVTDLTPAVIQAWMDDMAATDLALSTMRVRQSTLSSFCTWLVKREVLAANPVARLERPPHHREPPKQVPEAALFWSTWGRRAVGKTLAPMTGKNIWRLCKVHGRLIGYPELKPHDLRHGVAMEVYEEHHDLEQVRALLGHSRIDTTQVYASIRPPHLKRAVSFYEEKAIRILTE